MQPSQPRTLRNALRALTVVGAGCAIALAAIPFASASGTATDTATDTSTTSATDTATDSSTDSSTDAGGTSVLPVGPIEVPKYTRVGTELSVMFFCSAEPAADGSVPSAVTAEHVGSDSLPLATYDITKNGRVEYFPAGSSIRVVWTWKLDAAIKPATGFILRIACADTFDEADPESFVKAETNVVLPPNKFIKATFPKTVKQGEKITFDVQCERSAAGIFTLRNAAGGTILYSTNLDEGDSSDGVVKTSTPTGFNVVAIVPADAAAGDYTVDFECASGKTDVPAMWREQEPSDAVKSPALPLGLLATELPRLL